ncbi:MAG TPA: hypothetical protein PKA60_03040, partial [Candidatus Paceibacterota bacterium]|nr:hypothetical protein [Candidatus Paceibacterota bacterium]
PPMIYFGIVGLLIISYAIWIREEIRQNIFFIIGGLALLVYSIYIENWIFIVLQIIFAFSAIIELTKLLRNKNK